MSMIEVRNFVKDFKIARNTGRSIRDFFSRDYEIKRAVNNVSFSIEEGEIVGYIGPNGAGKSTTIKSLTGILVPTSGEIFVNGLVPYKNRKEHSKSIGVVFGQRTQLWWELPVADSFNLLRHIFKVPENVYKRNMEMFHDVIGIGEFINRSVRQLSLGQRMRADFAASLLHSPKVLFLDEPTIGLDIIAKEKIREFILTLNRTNKVTVILTSHDVSDIEKLCHRTIVIDKGNIIYEGDIGMMKDRFGKYRTLVLDIRGDFHGIDIPNTEIVKEQGPKKWIRFDRELCTPANIVGVLMRKYEVIDFTVEEPEIESIIKRIYIGSDDDKEREAR